jgi:hypothetical protein
VVELKTYKQVALMDGTQFLTASLSTTCSFVQVLEKIAQDNYALYLLTFPSLEKVEF